MALPNSGITISLVKNAIGESVTTVGGLVTSPNVNRWGFNSPYPPQQSKYWGNYAPAAPHDLGAFRGYDHYWRCFSTGSASITGNLSTYRQGWIEITLNFFPEWSTIPGTTTHYFDVFMSRSGSGFTNPASYTQIADNVGINNNGTYSLLVNPSAPPDNGSVALPANSTFWLKFKHVSSDDRRFDSRMFNATSNFIRDPNDYDGWILTVNVGEYPFTNQIYVGLIGYESPVVSKWSTNNFIWFPLRFTNSWETSQTVDSVLIQVNNQSDFNGATDTVVSSTINATIPAATYDGTLHYGTLDTAGGSNVSLSRWSLNEAFYGRVSIDGGLSWSTGWNGYVTNTPLQN